MHRIYVFFIMLLLLSACAASHPPQDLFAQNCCGKVGVEATCSGTKSCSACKNCKYCKHCSKEGGTCGVCK